jgi:hypothetical protein
MREGVFFKFWFQNVTVRMPTSCETPIIFIALFSYLESCKIETELIITPLVSTVMKIRNLNRSKVKKRGKRHSTSLKLVD